jgi:hypothetical protein
VMQIIQVAKLADLSGRLLALDEVPFEKRD